MRNKVFIATSLDGHIADAAGGIDWLTDLPIPTNGDGGFSKFIESIDALVIGRKTFEKVLSFGVEWPYSKKVFVWTKNPELIPFSLQDKVEAVSGCVAEILHTIYQKGYSSLYVDGGQTIQSFLREDSIHEIILTKVPVVLGGGIPLFANVPRKRLFHKSTQVFDNGMVQSHYEVLPVSRSGAVKDS